MLIAVYASSFRRLDSRKRVTYTRTPIITVDSPDDEHMGARNT